LVASKSIVAISLVAVVTGAIVAFIFMVLSASENDVRFHQALCTVGISSTALESLGGCAALPPIGSD
jgi:hypothetical protein